MTALVWFRRDLRLTDNPALLAALGAHEQVIAIYIDDPAGEAPWSPGGASRWWLHHSLKVLDASLRARGSRLIIRRGDSLAALRTLITDTKASAVYWNRCYEPAVIARDSHIKQALQERSVEAHSRNSTLWREPWELKTGAGDPYRVFTPFWRSLGSQLPALAVQPAPSQLPAPAATLHSEPLAALALLPKIAWDAGFASHWQPGEDGALQALATFADGDLAHYRDGRDFPARGGVSRLSPHLHFGELSPQQARAAVLGASSGHAVLEPHAEHFLRELGWREFAYHLLYHFPKTVDAPMYDKFAPFPWRAASDYRADLRAWQRGATGIPIVDAGMRQLWSSGWMHNRVRMIVASLLTKNLLIPWQEGARWFWDTLLDADLASNTLGWQWSAGCGADAAPYFRIFNPVLQSQRFDADGSYIRRWVPELAKLPDRAIHTPWTAEAGLLHAAGVRLGDNYPRPIIELATSRERALAAYAQIKTG